MLARGFLRVAAVGCVAVLLTGCFGRFAVTRNLYAFNGYVSKNDWARTGVFLAMNVTAMYPVGLIMDLLFANPVEFWTGVNPIKDSERWFRTASGAAYRVVERSGDRVRIESRGADGVARSFTIEARDGGLDLFDGDGALIARRDAR